MEEGEDLIAVATLTGLSKMIYNDYLINVPMPDATPLIIIQQNSPLQMNHVGMLHLWNVISVIAFHLHVQTYKITSLRAGLPQRGSCPYIDATEITFLSNIILTNTRAYGKQRRTEGQTERENRVTVYCNLWSFG